MTVRVTDKSVGEKVKGVIDHILRLQSYIQKMQALHVDNQEYAYLKALLLFSPGTRFTGALGRQCVLGAAVSAIM